MTRILFCFLFLLVSSRGLLAADSSEQFLNAYQAYQEGEKLERNGSGQDALRKYKFAESLLEEIEKNDPSWQKAVVEYRLKKTRDGLGRLQSGGASDGATLSPAPEVAPSGNTADASRSSQGPSISIVPPGSSSNSNSGDASSEVKRLKKMLEKLRGQLQEAKDAMTSDKNRTKDLESIKWVEERSKLEKELQVTKNQVADLNEKLQKRDSWESDLKSLQKKLDDTVADKVAMEEEYKGRVKKKDEANTQLQQQLEEVRGKLALGTASEQKYQKLSADLDSAKKEMASMKEQLDRAGQVAKDYEAKNDSLKQEITATSEKLKVAIKQSDELAPLREKFQKLQQNLATTDADSKASRLRVADLEKEEQQIKVDSAKREAGLKADLQALEEERNAIAGKVAQLSDAARDAGKVKGLEAEAVALKKTIVELQERQVIANQEVTKARADAEETAKVIKKTQDTLAESVAKASADKAVIEEEKMRLLAKLADATRQNSEIRKVADSAAPLSKEVEDLKSKLIRNGKDLEETKSRLVNASQADKAVLEEERLRLIAKLEEATRQGEDLRKIAATTGPLSSEIENLKTQLAENDKASESAKRKSDEAIKAAANRQSDLQSKLDASLSLKKLIEGQNAALQSQLKGAMGQMAALVDHGQDTGGLRDQIAKLQQQVDSNAADYAKSQQQISDLNKARPEQEKLIQQKQEELAAAKDAAEKLRAELDKANQKNADLQHHSDESDDRLKKLQDQLAVLSKTMPQKDKELADAQGEAGKLRSELTDVKSKLSDLEKKGLSGTDQLKDLKDSLAEKDAQLARYKKRKGKSVADEKMAEENDLLRGIVLRQVKEEARRSQARRLLEDEMKRLNVQSQTLSDQITVLSTPATELTPQERSLFKAGQMVVADYGNGKIEASVSAPITKVDSASVTTTAQESKVSDQGSPAQVVTPSRPAPSGAKTNTDSQEMPWEGKLKECLAKAKDEFDRQDYLQAENTFQEALKISPDDYFALSNIGVVEFQLGKMTEAETYLKRAASKSKDSSFALTTLGIVHYRQQRLDDAQKVLRKAVEVNSQDFTAHNYLGIVLAASGNGKAGEGEIMRAIEINPQYADAHFNLAVIYATGKPPARMMAKKHYAKAIELGAPPDPSLERLVQ